MKIIIGRHGNTFGPKDKVVWVGSRTDLDLVESGISQAERAGEALARLGIKPTRAISGPLKRTRQFMDIQLSYLDQTCEVEIHDALKEIDYGQWEGLSNDEIAQKYGEAKMNEWSHDSIFQTDAGWSPNEDEIINNVTRLAHDIVEQRKSNDDIIMINTSNGILRYFLKLVPAEYNRLFAQKEMKVKTGNLCFFSWDEENGFHLDQWNVKPTDL